MNKPPSGKPGAVHFAKYGERGENTSLIKGSPILPDAAALPSLAALPAFGAEYRARRAAEPAAVIFESEYEILPTHDINGVGLLYFAAYPTVFDLCLERAEGKGFLIGHSTVSKDILYFANSEPTETLLFRLHAREQDGDVLSHTASLSRKSDGKRMSEVVSVKLALAGLRGECPAEPCPDAERRSFGDCAACPTSDAIVPKPWTTRHRSCQPSSPAGTARCRRSKAILCGWSNGRAPVLAFQGCPE